jgi:hypothetical protein
MFFRTGASESVDRKVGAKERDDLAGFDPGKVFLLAHWDENEAAPDGLVFIRCSRTWCPR